MIAFSSRSMTYVLHFSALVHLPKMYHETTKERINLGLVGFVMQMSAYILTWHRVMKVTLKSLGWFIKDKLIYSIFNPEIDIHQKLWKYAILVQRSTNKIIWNIKFQ